MFISNVEPFDGLFGVFNDSLPDGWGRLITDRYLLKNGVNPNEVTPLTRLTLLTPERTGALRFEPSKTSSSSFISSDLDELYNETKEILADKNSSKFIDEFFIMGTSNGL